MSGFLDIYMDFFCWSVNYWSVFCTYFRDKYLRNLKFQRMVFPNFLLNLMKSFDQKQKNLVIFKKNFTDRKNCDVCFGKHVETNFDHPQFSSILVPKNLNETKHLPLASMGKHENIRANTMTQISYRLLLLCKMFYYTVF